MAYTGKMMKAHTKIRAIYIPKESSMRDLFDDR